VTSRLIFRCEICGCEPGQLSQISLERQLLHFRFGEYVDAGPDGWLVWTGRGPYGRALYSCGEHRAELRAYVIRHYSGPHARSKRSYPSLPPDDLAVARRRARYRGWAGPVRRQAPSDQ
jgi:hypothetical protein